MEFVNCDFTMLRETLTLTGNYSNSGVYGNGSGRRPGWFVDSDSTATMTQSVVSFDIEQSGNVFVPWFGNSQPGFETGAMTVRECIFYLGDNPGRDAGAFFRMQDPTKTFIYEDNQFIGGDPVRGWGAIDGSASSVMRNNRSYGSGSANLPNSPAEGNFAQDADIFQQFNTNFPVNQRIVRPQGGNFAQGTIQVLLRRDGTFNCEIVDCDLPRTSQNFNPPSNNNRRANLLWLYSQNATVTDDFDGLPEQNVRLDIVPTSTDSFSSATTKFSDVGGAFTETEILHSRDFFQGNNAKVLTNYGPFRIRYAKYEFIAQDRSGDPYDAVRVAEGPRLLRDPTIVNTTAPSATRSITNLDELRDSWKLETIDDLGLPDLSAGGGVLDAGSLDIVFDGNQTGNTIQRTGSEVRIKADAGEVAAGSVYSVIQTTGSLTLVDGATVSPFVILSSASGERVPVTVTCVESDGTPIQNARVRVELVSDGTVVLEGLTNVSGVLVGTFSGSTPADVVGVTRKANASDNPKFQQGNIVGTIAEGSGLAVTVVMIPDE